ncbi:hypothetical protein [Sphingomonas sp. DT-204]|uniref:hypothetical protein n=1 Tax=Sphingomonas sp. DT-204 TaxID=3396166 RepID=UPI003F1DA07B
MRAITSYFSRYVVPGLVIQAVLVGGGYATGRELVEFFLQSGPATGFVGFALTAALFSIGAMISFELARRFRAFDYRSFCKVYLGRFWFLFELGYALSLLLVLSVVSAAAGKLLAEVLGTPSMANAVGFITIVAGLVVFGSAFVERVISAWSLLFYVTYGSMLVVVLMRFGDQMGAAIAMAPIDLGDAIANGLAYTGYNIPLLPILIFVARDFASPREALVAGAITGPLVLAPGLAFLLALSAFYPAIIASPLPVTAVLAAIDIPALGALVELVIFGALVKTGVGLLHGLNERIAAAMAENARPMPYWVRPAVALGALVFTLYLAAAVGLVALIAHGYRFISAYFLAVFVAPLLTIGLWRLLRGDGIAERVPA